MPFGEVTVKSLGTAGLKGFGAGALAGLGFASVLTGINRDKIKL